MFQTKETFYKTKNIMKKTNSFLFQITFSFLILAATFLQGASSDNNYNIKLLGSHDIVEMFGCNKKVISDRSQLERILAKAADLAGAKKIGLISNYVSNHNSCIVLVSESHFSIHAFPLLGYAAIDVFTCGDCDNEKGIAYIKQQLQVKSNHSKKIVRGIFKQGLSCSQYNPCKNDQKGEHFIVELYGCEEVIINNEKKVEEILISAIQKIDVQVVDAVSYKFHPQGVSCIVLAENGAQITIHTWPEISEKYCAIDILVFGDSKPDDAFAFLTKELKSKNSKVIKIPRGFSKAGISEYIDPQENLSRASALTNKV